MNLCAARWVTIIPIVKTIKKLKIFTRERFFTGKVVDAAGHKDLAWYTEAGTEFAEADWHDGNRHALSYLVKNDHDFVLVVFNANYQKLEWKLPEIGGKKTWSLLLDTSESFADKEKLGNGKVVGIPAWSVLAFEIK